MQRPPSLRVILAVVVVSSWNAVVTLGLMAQASHPPVRVPAGFSVSVVYDVPRDQGSWVSLANADRGRLIACDQHGKLYRITLGLGQGQAARVEELKTPVGHAQGLLYAFDSLYVMGQEVTPGPPRADGGKAKNTTRSGLFRLRDTTGDDQFDAVEHLLDVPVGGEHHAHAIVPSPDLASIYICAGNMARIPKPDFTSARMPRVFRGDHLIARMPDAGGHNTGALPIGGWIARLSPDGKTRELIANGFRNAYDIAFAADGELFTYDSDMEWDIGCAWYRPTRICHVVSGAEFGWRWGSGKWPEYFADSLPSVLDIGPGSPTGVVFGTGARFPARYQQAMFAADWSYGVIYAVHLARHGASYSAEKEVFATAAPFPVTDLLIRPQDGAMYFAVGGRGARSALYKIHYAGVDAMAPAVGSPADGAAADGSPADGAAADGSPPDGAVADGRLHRLRRQLESLHQAGAQGAVTTAWPHLGHDDRHIRFAARLVIEHQPVESWAPRFFAEEHPRRLIHAAIALARHLAADRILTVLPRRVGENLAAEILGRLHDKVHWARLPTAQRLELLRAYGLLLARLESIGEAVRGRIAARLAVVYPDADRQVNRELCRLLCSLDEPSVIGTSLTLQAQAPAQEEQMHYAYCLRMVTRGWTLDLRRAYLQWFLRATGYRGGSSFLGFCRNIRTDAISRMPEQARLALGDLVNRAPEQKTVEPVAARSFVKAWKADELVALLEKKAAGHDFARGRRLFGAAACVRCHRFAGEGGAVGPDLTSVGGRFGVREILEATIEPSKVISDQYQPTVFDLVNGDTVVGYVANYSSGKIKVVEDMLKPGDFTDVKVADISSRSPSPVSMMPPGLLNTLTAAEVQDLVAYLRGGGDPAHPLFQ
jgi:hypothetical protein